MFSSFFLCTRSLGLKGCKNVRSGGDTCHATGRDGEHYEGPFLTYIVYKSYKYPPEKRIRLNN